MSSSLLNNSYVKSQILQVLNSVSVTLENKKEEFTETILLKRTKLDELILVKVSQLEKFSKLVKGTKEIIEKSLFQELVDEKAEFVKKIIENNRYCEEFLKEVVDDHELVGNKNIGKCSNCEKGKKCQEKLKSALDENLMMKKELEIIKSKSVDSSKLCNFLEYKCQNLESEQVKTKQKIANLKKKLDSLKSQLKLKKLRICKLYTKFDSNVSIENVYKKKLKTSYDKLVSKDAEKDVLISDKLKLSKELAECKKFIEGLKEEVGKAMLNEKVFRDVAKKRLDQLEDKTEVSKIMESKIDDLQIELASRVSMFEELNEHISKLKKVHEDFVQNVYEVIGIENNSRKTVEEKAKNVIPALVKLKSQFQYSYFIQGLVPVQKKYNNFILPRIEKGNLWIYQMNDCIYYSNYIEKHDLCTIGPIQNFISFTVSASFNIFAIISYNKVSFYKIETDNCPFIGSLNLENLKSIHFDRDVNYVVISFSVGKKLFQFNKEGKTIMEATDKKIFICQNDETIIIVN